MHRQRTKKTGPTLSIDDQKALDVLLDHSANGHDHKLARHAPAVGPRRMMAVSKVLELLSEMPASDPPKNLVARTMARVAQDIATQVGSRASHSHKITATHQIH